MPTSRNDLLAALEPACVALPAMDRASNYREAFVELVALDPQLAGGGRGKRAGYLLGAVLQALRERGRNSTAAADRGIDADHQAGSEDDRDAGDVGDALEREEDEESHKVHHAARHDE